MAGSQEGSLRKRVRDSMEVGSGPLGKNYKGMKDTRTGGSVAKGAPRKKGGIWQWYTSKVIDPITDWVWERMNK